MQNIEKSQYKEFIITIKQKIKNTQIKASIKVNIELLRLYWDIAKMIVEKQKESSWGDDIISNISKDLKVEFPNIKGFSKRNIFYMKQWYIFFSKVQQPVAQLEDDIFKIPWGHNIAIITKIKDIKIARFYIQKTIENSYSRATLVEQIDNQLHLREGKAITNFTQKLPNPHSNLAIETLKDPYKFDFLTLRERYDELELEDALMENMTKFLLELGQGFSFVGRQYRLDVGGKEFKIDLLFYHIKLYCYVVVELKVVDFKPEFAGKLNFYISAVDGKLKGERDNPTIGILICKSKNDTIVEYSLKDINKPMGVSEYQLTQVLPKEFKSSLPSIEDIEEEFAQENYNYLKDISK
ncbi:FIG074102: hypothetical protein [hydrothermal vent metagenome]|uniref:Cytoplasmic protein n=1 Tax=hydrothermal vent metagenome TaxID=652676 RepID=A0A1W1EKP1_9ZZZZ